MQIGLKKYFRNSKNNYLLYKLKNLSIKFKFM